MKTDSKFYGDVRAALKTLIREKDVNDDDGQKVRGIMEKAEERGHTVHLEDNEIGRVIAEGIKLNRS